MEGFPFTASEWAAVNAAAMSVVNAGLAGDDVLHAANLAELFDVLDGLRARYGEHPVLLETTADFTADAGDQIDLYRHRRAADTAAAHGLPTLTIRFDLARVLLDVGRPGDAAGELAACEGELADGDEADRAAWAELAAAARQTSQRRRHPPAAAAAAPAGPSSSHCSAAVFENATAIPAAGSVPAVSSPRPA